MLKRAIASQLVTRPSIWGKVSAHADFVSSRVGKGEQESWEHWLVTQLHVLSEAAETPISATLPAAFVLPPGALPFAPRRFVVGVVACSVDRMGRAHALVVYQSAHPRWLIQHFATHAEYPHDWFFWLARALARHAGLSEVADIHALERAIDELWRLHAPNARSLLPAQWRAAVDPAALISRSSEVLDRLMGVTARDDLACRLSGVRFLPWTDWPGCLSSSRSVDADLEAITEEDITSFEGAFWQQDDAGGFVNASARLADLLNASS